VVAEAGHSGIGRLLQVTERRWLYLSEVGAGAAVAI